MARKKSELLQGTLDMFILKILEDGPMHGYAIVRRIQLITEDVLRVEEGSLYPALYRMAGKKWIEAEWGVSDSNRRRKYYQLTKLGRKQLSEEIASWERFYAAATNILEPSPRGT